MGCAWKGGGGTAAALNGGMRKLGLLVTLLPVLAISACDGWNSVEHGRYDVLTFTPDDCARSSCDLDDSIVVGGTFTVKLEAVNGGNIDGLTLISSDPWVMDVYPLDWGAYSADFEVIGTGQGWADLIAIDRYGYEVDYITIRVQHADHLYLDMAGGNADLAAESVPGGEVWNVTAGERVVFDVEASSGSWEMMGRLGFDVVIDELLLAAMDVDARLNEGHLSFLAPAGTHDVAFVAPDGTRLDVRFIAR
jgi:hypothetical protein